ncbi:MAG: 5-formyltetrahydrofolate cyclo-ligase, partial [Prevotella pleuritidis]|nr:5-formyltetrahydrofolate cyclo-ligase [Hoylesella pleuritidis]
MLKSQLRQEIKDRKRQFSRAQLDELSQTITARLLAHPRLRAANTVLLYYSLPDEVNTHTIIDRLVATGKQILLPVV